MDMNNHHRPSSGLGSGKLSRVLAYCLGFVAVVVALAACGSSSSSSSSATSAASSATSSTAAASSSSGGSASACVPEATQLVSKQKAPMPEILPADSLNMASSKGKTFWYISPSQATGYALSVSQGLSAAGKAAGVNITIFDGKGQPTRFTQGVEQAVAQKAGGIILYGINPALVPQGLAQAKSAHIPVVSVLTGTPAPSTGTVAEAINEDVTGGAKAMADYSAFYTQCKVDGATSFDPVYPSLVTEKETIKAELARLCPTTCKVQDHQMSLATMATALAPSVQNLIQRNPTLNTIFATFDQAATYENPAVSSSSSKVKIVGTDGLSPNVDAIRKGSAQIADVSYVPAPYLGWLALDQVVRAVQAKPTGVNGQPITLPTQTFDKDNVGTSDAIPSLFPKYANYQSDFTKLWGVG
jgi:ribose transport system substrate-binding protein